MEYILYINKGNDGERLYMFVIPRPRIYPRPFMAGCAMPFIPPRPVITPMPFIGGFGCCSFRPMLPTVPTFPLLTPMFMAPMTYTPPLLASTNIFIQNMMQSAQQLAARYKQQAEMMEKFQQQLKQNNSSYKFGSLTSSLRFTNYNPYNITQPSFNYTISNNNNPGFWKKIGYNISSGLRLARTAMSKAVGFTGYCARYVKNAIASCGLGKYVSGNAYEMIRILRNNKNFKEIPAQGVNPNTLPPGCILVYERGVSGYSSKYGHTEITTGDGRAVSDGVTNNIRGNITAIFMPVA